MINLFIHNFVLLGKLMASSSSNNNNNRQLLPLRSISNRPCRCSGLLTISNNSNNSNNNKYNKYNSSNNNKFSNRKCLLLRTLAIRMGL
jgi:hypothetical protein